MATTKTTDLGNTSELRGALEQGQRMFRAFQHADQALALVEGLEQVTRERKELAAKAQAELAAVSADLTAAKADLVSAKAEAKEIRVKAKAAADKLAGDTAQNVAAVIQEAQAQVDALHTERDALVAELLEKKQ